jgi:hypothetical protein
MNCLQDYIGLRGCGSSTPGSGLYVNDLPGISLKQIVSLTNEEEATYLDLWAMIQRRAQSRFSLDVREAMGKHYKLKSLMQGVNLGKQVENNTIVANPGISKAGFIIQLNESKNYEYVQSPLNAIHIQQLFFYAAPAENGIVFIYDIYTNDILFNKNVSFLNDGWNTIEVNQTFNSQALAVYITPTFLNGFGTYLETEVPLNHQIPGCCDIRINGFYTDTQWDAFTNDVLESQSSNTYGLSGIFNVVCTWDNLICNNKNIFARPLWYLTGIELLTEQLYSSKLNQFTTVNLQRAKELREEYQVEYAKAVEQIAGGFSLDCDCCLECAGAVQLRETNQFY